MRSIMTFLFLVKQRISSIDIFRSIQSSQFRGGSQYSSLFNRQNRNPCFLIHVSTALALLKNYVCSMSKENPGHLTTIVRLGELTIVFFIPSNAYTYKRRTSTIAKSIRVPSGRILSMRSTSTYYLSTSLGTEALLPSWARRAALVSSRLISSSPLPVLLEAALRQRVLTRARSLVYTFWEASLQETEYGSMIKSLALGPAILVQTMAANPTCEPTLNMVPPGLTSLPQVSMFSGLQDPMFLISLETSSSLGSIMISKPQMVLTSSSLSEKTTLFCCNYLAASNQHLTTSASAINAEESRQKKITIGMSILILIQLIKILQSRCNQLTISTALHLFDYHHAMACFSGCPGDDSRDDAIFLSQNITLPTRHDECPVLCFPFQLTVAVHRVQLNKLMKTPFSQHGLISTSKSLIPFGNKQQFYLHLLGGKTTESLKLWNR